MTTLQTRRTDSSVNRNEKWTTMSIRKYRGATNAKQLLQTLKNSSNLLPIVGDWEALEI